MLLSFSYLTVCISNGGRSLTPHHFVWSHTVLFNLTAGRSLMTNTHTINPEVILTLTAACMLTQAHVGTSSNTDHRPQQMDPSMRRQRRNSSLRESTLPLAEKVPGDIIFLFFCFTEQKLLSTFLCELKSHSFSPQRSKETLKKNK